jgi:ATP-dependent Clp protease ATP-binding subunit ClpA
MSEFPRTLDPSLLSEEVKKLETVLLRNVIGQERAVRQFVKTYAQMTVGLNRPKRPAAVFLFTGPTGVGKTSLVQHAALALLGSKDFITRVDCGEYTHSHEVSKLIGSPPGYVGFNDEKTIRLAQAKIDKFQKPECCINFVLFDEIEEAHETLLSAILQVLDAGRLTLGNGNEVDFSKTIVVLTSNLGEKEAQKALMGTSLGLNPPASDEAQTDDKIYRVSKAAATKHFKAKFVNRVDKIVVFRSLSEDSLRRILDLELAQLQDRIFRSAYRLWESRGEDKENPPAPFRPLIETTQSARNFLLKEGTSKIYGARELNRSIDRFMAFSAWCADRFKANHAW